MPSTQIDGHSGLATLPGSNFGTAEGMVRFEDIRPSEAEIQSEIKFVLEKELSPRLQQWTDGYSEVGKRNTYLWKWVRQGVEVTTLSSVSPDLYDEACDTKVIGVILDCLLDDVADQKGDPDLLEQLLDLPFGPAAPKLRRIPAENRAYAEFTFEVWEEIKRRTRRFPFFYDYASLWRYDYLQLFNAMRYSHLVNQDLTLLNMAEHDLYSSHNMHIMVSSTVDLMCSPEFSRTELGKLRDVVWHAQCMGRIGNLITTWERELGDGDYTSGVYARAVAHGHVKLAQLLENERDSIATAIRRGGHEEFFLQRWAQLRQHLVAMQSQIRSVDIARLRKGYERLIRLHLGSRGAK